MIVKFEQYTVILDESPAESKASTSQQEEKYARLQQAYDILGQQLNDIVDGNRAKVKDLVQEIDELKAILDGYSKSFFGQENDVLKKERVHLNMHLDEYKGKNKYLVAENAELKEDNGKWESLAKKYQALIEETNAAKDKIENKYAYANSKQYNALTKAKYVLDYCMRVKYHPSTGMNNATVQQAFDAVNDALDNVGI